VAFLLKLKPEYHLGDAVRERQRMDSDLWGRLAVTCQGINVLLAPENPAAPVEIDRQVAGELMAFWRSHYEAIVLDTAGAQPAGLEFARLADEVLVVTTNELAALHAARRTIECLEQNGIDRLRLRLIVNRYTPSTGLKREEVETALKMTPFALLANDYELLQQAVLEGRPAAAASRFGRSVQALAERLEGQEPPAKKRAGWFGLIPRR
jgi:pilus assembly protein CpaE